MKGGINIYLNIKLRRYSLIGIIISAALLMCSLLVSGYSNEYIAAGASENNEISLPIVMYHSMLKDKKLQGEFVIGPDQFEEDLKTIKEKGYQTIVMADLIDYVENGAPLPKKPIMLTFDDGCYNNYLYAFPLLKKYDCKIVLSPIAYYSDKYSESLDMAASYANCTWENLKEMMNSGYVELQNHSYNLHNSKGDRLGVKQKSGESDGAYREMLVSDITKAQNRFRDELNYSPTTFTYPFGAYSDLSEKIIKEMGFKATIICEKKVNKITRNKDCLYGLGRFLRSNKDESKSFFEKFSET